ncbi:MAG: serine hydrolase [Bacteroidia bacterium]
MSIISFFYDAYHNFTFGRVSFLSSSISKYSITPLISQNNLKKIYPILIFLLFALSANGQNGFQPFIDSLANAYLQDHPGALVIGIHDNGKEKVFYYGETTKGSKQKPDSNSIFKVGGISETFTCILYADFVIRGVIKMDEKLQDFLPVNVPSPVYEKIICRKADETSQLHQVGEHENVTINYTPYVCFPDPSSKPQSIILSDLATHTTGLPEYPDNLKTKKNKSNPFENYTKENLYDFLKEYRFDKPLGYDYKHSATGIALLGHALVLKSKIDFDTLISERILKPLQMTETRVHLTKLQQQRLIQGYDKNGKTAHHWNYDVMAPAGGLHSTAHDMMKFLAANINLHKDSIVNLLDYTHNPRLELTDKNGKGTEIALGWKVDQLGVDEKRIVWQDGSTGGFNSYIGFVETNHTGVVILSSVSNSVITIGEELLRKLSHEKL